MQSAEIAAIILTKNEERDLPACLASLKGVVSEIHVVDSGSTDSTVALARGFGARVYTHDFVNQALQFNWALENITSECQWVLRIDADERLSPELQCWVREQAPWLGPEVTGVLLPRRIRFLGRSLRWGDSYPVWLLRLFRRRYGRCEASWMDEHIVVSEGTVIHARGDLIHEIPKSVAEWTRKHVWYAERECRDILGGVTGASNLAGQPGLRRRLKQRVYLHLPLFVRPFCYWFYRYFLRLGFLDGRAGLIYHFLQGFWYRFLVDAQLYELEQKRGNHRGLWGHREGERGGTC